MGKKKAASKTELPEPPKRAPAPPPRKIKSLPVNKFRGRCAADGCGKSVDVGQGFIERSDLTGKWITWCRDHVPGGFPTANRPAEPEERRWLAQVLENPDDDDIRLVYADWLEERGDPRGHFIRVQCQLAKLPTGDHRRAELEKDEQRLLKTHARVWGAEIDSSGLVHSFEFCRGFVENVLLRADKFLAHGAKLFELAPIRHIKLTHIRDHIEALAESALIGRLRSLGLKCSDVPMGAERARILLASPHLAGLSALDLGKHKIRAGGVAALAAARYPKLTQLRLDDNELDDRAIEALAAWPDLEHVTELDLSMNRIADPGVRALSQSRFIGKLRSLDLKDNKFRAEGVVWLAARIFAN